MDSGFIDILKQLVSEQTSAALTDVRRCKALLADYARNEYKKECRLLVQAVEAGIAKKIDGADDLVACKKAQIREMEEGYDINPVSAANIVNALALVLRGDATITKSPFAERAVPAYGSTFTDPRDGQTYRTVKMGGLVWMAENLNYKAEGSWCYGDDELSGKKYGRLYAWDAAMAAVPKGWRLPIREDWAKLVEVAGGKEVAGIRLKSKAGWDDRKDGASGNGTDEFGFSAMPGGSRSPSGGFGSVGSGGFWWSATEYDASNVYYRGMYYNDGSVFEFYQYGRNGFSVRCVALGA